MAAYTGFPEMMDGRIKTLHPKIHGGILCRRDSPDDMAAIAEQGIVPFELVVVNLYPFRETVAKPDVTIEEAIEKIDIGGPTLIRAAAKNHAFVTVACEPAQYRQDSRADAGEQRSDDARVAARVWRERRFAHTAMYDAADRRLLCRNLTTSRAPTIGEDVSGFPDRLTIELQANGIAALRREPASSGGAVCVARRGARFARPRRAAARQGAVVQQLARSRQRAGRSCDRCRCRAWRCIKHNNPCGAATAETLGEAMRRAWEGDPLSAFGSVLGFNVPVDAATAEFLAEPDRFVEAIVAPDFTPEAFEILTTKPKWKANVRLLKVGRNRAAAAASASCGRSAAACSAKRPTIVPDDEAEWKVVTERRADRGPAHRPAVRLGRVPAREVERHRAGEGSARSSASARGR